MAKIQSLENLKSFLKTPEGKAYAQAQANKTSLPTEGLPKNEITDAESENKPKFNITTILLIAAGLFVLYNATKKR